MGKDFTAIYKILKHLDRYAGDEDCDMRMISAEELGISEVKWEQLIIELAENGYIKGVVYSQMLNDKFPHIAGVIHPRITLKGMEYLEENSKMKKAAQIVGGIVGLAK